MFTNSYSIDWSGQPRYVINAHSPLRAQEAGAGITKRLRGFPSKIDKKISSLGKSFLVIQDLLINTFGTFLAIRKNSGGFL